MQNSQSDNSTVAKLLEADAELAAQEIELNAQLKSIGEKRYSLKTVIDMFASVNTAATPIATSAQPETIATQQVSTPLTQSPVVQDVDSPELNSAANTTAEIVAATTEKRQGKKNLAPNSTKESKKSTSAKEQSRNTNDWHQYVKDDFGNATLSEAVFVVMQQHSKQVLEITTIIDAIFTHELPKQMRSTARERVSNVLSVGAKNGKWYRGQLGKYSMSKAAFEEHAST